MDVPSVSTQSSVAANYPVQQAAQPQEQQARSLRNERERENATQANYQVTLSGASQQPATRETERVVPQNEVSATSDKSQETDRVEQMRQAKIETQRNDQPVPRSVARALETYTQTSVL
jgi:hypothetical protein